MSGLRILLVVLTTFPMPVRALESSIVSDFAVCAGRFSAELEHAWLVHDDRAGEIERRRLLFIELIDASIPPERRRHTLNLRVGAKAAHASLLTQGTFSQDRALALWAVRRAEDEIAYCRSFLLESLPPRRN